MTPKLLLAACISIAIFMPHLADAQGGRGGRGGHGGAGFYQPGYQVQILPPGYTSLRVGLSRYYYDGRVFYRPVGRPPAYVVVAAPFGARVSRLPLGYVSFFIGPSQYFYLNSTWFLYDDRRTEYVVVREPDGAQDAMIAASENTSGDIFVYPAEGQSEEQRDRDRYDCHLWASEQTGFSPESGVPNPTKASEYRRAISACLEGRGYTIK